MVNNKILCKNSLLNCVNITFATYAIFTKSYQMCVRGNELHYLIFHVIYFYRIYRNRNDKVIKLQWLT